MIPLVKVAEVKALEGYRLALTFTDGSEGVEDLSYLIERGGVMVQPLRDPAFFARVFLSFGVPHWPNGYAVDAIALHMKLAGEGKLQQPVAAE